MLEICRRNLYVISIFVDIKMLVTFSQIELNLFALLLNLWISFSDVDDIGKAERQVDGKSSPLYNLPRYVKKFTSHQFMWAMATPPSPTRPYMLNLILYPSGIHSSHNEPHFSSSIYAVYESSLKVCRLFISALLVVSSLLFIYCPFRWYKYRPITEIGPNIAASFFMSVRVQ
jgi:hypothetical protein